APNDYGSNVLALPLFRCFWTIPAVYRKRRCEPAGELLAFLYFFGACNGLEKRALYLYFPSIFPLAAEGLRGSRLCGRCGHSRYLYKGHAAKCSSRNCYGYAIFIHLAVE